MLWLVLYAAAAFVVGVALFVLAEFRRAPDTPGPEWPGVRAVAAGFLWPLLLIGAAQYGLLLAIGHRLGGSIARLDGGPTRVPQRVG